MADRNQKIQGRGGGHIPPNIDEAFDIFQRCDKEGIPSLIPYSRTDKYVQMRETVPPSKIILELPGKYVALKINVHKAN